ncbi:MAG: type II secretion system F family protein [Pirellulales bacterium]
MTWLFAFRLLGFSVPLAVAYLAVSRDWLPAKSGAILGASLGVCGLLAPSFWLDRKINERLNQLRKSLPDFLDLLIICLESGLSMHGSLLRVSEEIRLAHPLLAGELGIVIRDVGLGSNIDAAFVRCADRTGFEELRGFGSIVREAQRFGTELSAAFSTQADSLRFEREQNAEESAQKSGGQNLVADVAAHFAGRVYRLGRSRGDSHPRGVRQMNRKTARIRLGFRRALRRGRRRMRRDSAVASFALLRLFRFRTRRVDACDPL